MIAMQSCNICPIAHLPGYYVCQTHDTFLTMHKHTCGTYNAMLSVQNVLVSIDQRLLNREVIMHRIDEALQVLAHGQHPHPDQPTPEGNKHG